MALSRSVNAFAALALLGAYPSISSASLVGNNVTFYHLWSASMPPSPYVNVPRNLQNVTVGSGVEYYYDSIVPQYSVDISDHSIVLSILVDNQFNTYGTFNGVVISGLYDSGGLPLSAIYGFSSSTSKVGLPQIAFGRNWVSIDLGRDPNDTYLRAGQKVSFDLAFGDVPPISPVPAPPAFILMLSGLGLFGLTKKLKARK